MVYSYYWVQAWCILWLQLAQYKHGFSSSYSEVLHYDTLPHRSLFLERLILASNVDNQLFLRFLKTCIDQLFLLSKQWSTPLPAYIHSILLDSSASKLSSYFFQYKFSVAICMLFQYLSQNVPYYNVCTRSFNFSVFTSICAQNSV